LSRRGAPVALLTAACLVYAAAVGERTWAEACRRSADDLLWGGDAEQSALRFAQAASLDFLGTSGRIGEGDALFEQAELSHVGSPAQVDMLQQAIAAYRGALARNPGDSGAWAQLGRAFRGLAVARRASRPIDIGRLDDVGSFRQPEDDLAIAALERSIELEPNNYDYVNYLADVRYALGDPEALDDYRRGARILPKLQSHPHLQEPSVPSEVVNAALEGAREAIGDGNVVSDPKILEELAMYLASRGDLAGALAANLESIHAGNLSPAWLWTRQGIWLYNLGRRPEARQALTEAIRIDPQRSSAYLVLGRLDVTDGDLAAAVVNLTRARDLAPEDLRFQMELARALDQADRFEEAEREYERALRMPGGDVTAATALVAMLSRHGVFDRALIHAKRLLAAHPGERVFKEQVADLSARLTF